MMNSNSVRRNLFHGNLSRRPASAGPPNGAMPPNPNGVSNRPSNRLKPTSSDSGPQIRAHKAENKDIVVRDKNGAYKLEVPTLPPALVGEDGEELVEMEENFNPAELTGREKESMLSGTYVLGCADAGVDFEKALVEMMIRHRNRMSDDEPDGAFPALQNPYVDD